MSIEKQNIETVQAEPQLTVEFLDGSCTLGYPKLEPANLQLTNAYDKTIALIASCLVSVVKDGKNHTYEMLTLPQKMAIVGSWSFAKMKAVADALPNFLGKYYLKLYKEKENGN